MAKAMLSKKRKIVFFTVSKPNLHPRTGLSQDSFGKRTDSARPTERIKDIQAELILFYEVCRRTNSWHRQFKAFSMK